MTEPHESPREDADTTEAPDGSIPSGAAIVPTPLPTTPAPDRRPRPLIERIGMAAIAVVMGGLFGVVAVAAFAGGEPFLGAMGAGGALMVLWLGALTLIRG